MGPAMMRRVAAFLALFALGSVDAHAEQRTFPSLARRPAELRGPQSEPTPAAVQPAAPDAALVQTVGDLQTRATTADAAFQTEIGKSRTSVSAANGAQPMSETWVVAQMSITAADSARYESVAALASLDTLNVERQNDVDGARVAADLATINPVRTRVLAMVDAQNDTLDSLRKTLTQP